MHALYQYVLAEFEPPALEVLRRDASVDFVARRKSEGGAETDFKLLAAAEIPPAKDMRCNACNFVQICLRFSNLGRPCWLGERYRAWGCE